MLTCQTSLFFFLPRSGETIQAQQSVQDQLTPLIDMKEEGKKTFFATRKRIDAALAASDKVLKDKEKQYVAAVKKMDTVIDKFDIAREKGGKAVRARLLRLATYV